jgi:hypothetical protein
MFKSRPCKYGCGTTVTSAVQECPKCSGVQPYPVSTQQRVIAWILFVAFLGILFVVCAFVTANL